MVGLLAKYTLKASVLTPLLSDELAPMSKSEIVDAGRNRYREI
jgi:hypothetical protein